MLMFFSFVSTILSIKPIFFVAGSDNSPIFSEIRDHSLYPECPSNIGRISIKDDLKFNTRFLSHYPNCVSKLFRVQINNKTQKVEQLPGINTESTSIDDTSIISNSFDPILNKIKQLGYQDNVNLFSVGYNYFLHPVKSYTVYRKLKQKIEQLFLSTGEKSILISIDQGSSFISIFLSNYSNSEWVKRYIDSVIFISPTFAGEPSLSNLFSQIIPPFVSNTEFKTSIMRMPGLLISLPNYAIFSNFTLPSDICNNVSHSFDFLKEHRKVDDESEKIFRTYIEKYLQNPVPEPPVPSLIIFNEKTAQTVINPVISISNDSRHDESIAVSVRYACSHWKSSKCIKSNKPSQIIFEYINGHASQKRHKLGEKVKQAIEGSIPILNPTDNYANSGYVTSHTVDKSMFTYSAPEGLGSYAAANIFDGSSTSYYVSSTSNETTIEITFNEDISLEAFLYDTAYATSSQTRFFHGFPAVVHAYTALGSGSTYKLSAVFEGNPQASWSRVQYVFPEFVRCNKLKLVFSSISLQTMKNVPQGFNLVIAELIFIRHLFISSEDYYYNAGYLKTHTVDRSEFTYSASEGMADHPISNAFNDDSTTYYIAQNPNTESFKNYVEITFSQKVVLEGFLYFPILTNVGNTKVLQGLPTKMNFYASVGSNPYVLKSSVSGPGNPEWTRICYHFPEKIECEKLKIEFVEVMEQTLVGSSSSPVIAGLSFLKSINEVKYTNTNSKYSSNAYLETYSIPSSRFTFSGSPEASGYPLSYAFDDDPSTSFISGQENTDTFNNEITINFAETVFIEDIVYGLLYKTARNNRIYHGFPKILQVFKSLGNEPFTFCQCFTGIPTSPTTKIQFHFTKVVQCDKIKLEFVDVEVQSVINPQNTKCLIIGNLYFLQPHVANVHQIEGACENYMNQTYIDSVLVNQSEFTFTVDPAENGSSESYLFDKDSSTYYTSSLKTNRTFHNTLEIQFNEMVFLEAFLIDAPYYSDGVVRTFRGFPTGVKVYSAVENQPFSLNYFFVGEPVYPWTRIQFVFPSLIQCDKLKFEFLAASVTSILSIGELFILQPSIRPEPSEPTQIPISDVCDSSSHCSYEGSADHQVLITITTTVFNSIQSDENGGAIKVTNAGIVCTSLSFSGCQTNQGGTAGGGGGIYIENTIEMNNQITLNNVNFSNCKANYGGAVFIYSSSYESKVEIANCFFTSNQATKYSSSNSDSSFIGGSAMLIASKNLNIYECSFVRNFGENQLKIQNVFDENKDAVLLLEKNQKSTNVIKYCRFVINRLAKSSLYYTAGESGVNCYLRNSVFVGDLPAGGYHIDGIVITDKSPKLIVENCKFSSDYTMAFNPKSNEYITIVLRKQTFEYDGKEDKVDSTFNYIGIIMIVGVVILVFVILIVVKKQIDDAHIIDEIANQ